MVGQEQDYSPLMELTTIHQQSDAFHYEYKITDSDAAEM